MPIFWLALLIFILLTSVIYFTLFYSKFQVIKIEISGNGKVKSENIENTVWVALERKIFSAGLVNISSKSIFIIDKKKLTKDILNEFPGIQEVLVQKKMPDGLTLKITERQPFAVFCQNDNCFFIDENGVIFEPLENLPKDMVVLHKESVETNDLGKNIINKNIMDVIYKVQKNLKDNFQIGVKEVFVSELLVFKTSENWQIYFDPNSDIQLHITKMNILLKDEIPANTRKNIQYIYLQYKDRAYYK